MRLGLMQPYFFPYIGYFALLQQVDLFIILDEVQYIKGGWIARNRILNPDGLNWQYILVPLKKHSSRALIRQVQVDDQKAWRAKIMNQLAHYHQAPYYEAVKTILSTIFEMRGIKTISCLNTAALRQVCAYLGLETPVAVLSEMALDYQKPAAPDEWGLKIAQAIAGVTEYCNLPGGKSFFDPQKYEQAKIKLSFTTPDLRPYQQKGRAFVAGLSIIDLLMFQSPLEIVAMLAEKR